MQIFSLYTGLGHFLANFCLAELLYDLIINRLFHAGSVPNRFASRKAICFPFNAIDSSIKIEVNVAERSIYKLLFIECL